MGNNFNILHISDAHIGKPNTSLDWHYVLKPFLNDLTVMNQKGHNPDLIVFSGDLCFGELGDNSLEKQFLEAEKFISDIMQVFPEKPHFLIVPGNHDMDRIHIDDAHNAYIDSLDEEKVEKMMNKLTLTWKGIIDRQKKWSDFVKKVIKPPFSLDENFNVITGIINFKDYKKIGVVGLNSSWASYKDKQDGFLWIGKPQIQKAITSFSECDLTIACSHHPIGSLNTTEQSWMSSKIESNFRIHLHGHMHDQWFVDSSNHLRVAAGPCYQGSTKQNAYSWIQINFDESPSSIHLRTFEETGKGAWKGFHIPEKTNVEGVGTICNIFQNQRSSQIPSITDTTPCDSQEIKPITFNHLPDIEVFINHLVDKFQFRWEPASFSQNNNKVNLFWCVRLRGPNLIHAVQAFVAAGLQLKGANVELFIDDLGNVNANDKGLFSTAIKRWFGNISNSLELPKITYCSSIINDSDDAWRLLHDWLADQSITIHDVMKISKLISSPEPSSVLYDKLSTRKPRRIMSPPIVWASLHKLMEKSGDLRYITLGGYDEQLLWDTWRTKIIAPNRKPIGHLYIPALAPLNSQSKEPLHMADIGDRLIWQSRQDIINIFQEEYDQFGKNVFADINRIIPYCCLESILLPNFIGRNGESITIGTDNISDLVTLQKSDPNKAIPIIAQEVFNWLISNK